MENKEKEIHESRRDKDIILVIEGRISRMFYTCLYFQRLDYIVITAKNAEDGLACLRMTVPRIIIANVDLPDMNGLELLKQVKRRDSVRHVPVLFYTSNKDPKMQEECEDAGCAAYLRHPATLEDLYAAIQKSLNKPRRFVRLDTYIEVTVGDGITSDSYERMDYITAISEGGMFVSTKDPLPYGSISPFMFHLPTAPGWIFKVEGEVVYSKSSENGKYPGVGVKFLKIGNDEREMIRDFIRVKMLEGVSLAPEEPSACQV